MPLIITLLHLSVSLYFWAVSFVFRLWNFLYKRRIVDKAANEVLLISAGEAAAMIRRGEVINCLLFNLYVHLEVYSQKFMRPIKLYV